MPLLLVLISVRRSHFVVSPSPLIEHSIASLGTAITFHQLFEGLSLGIRIAGLPPSSTAGPRWLAPTLSILFAITTPLGMVGGMLAFPSRQAGESGAVLSLFSAEQ